MGKKQTVVGGGHHTCSKCGVIVFGSRIHRCKKPKQIEPNNWNGFFDLSSIKDIKTLKKFFREAIDLSYECKIDILENSVRREPWKDGTIDKFINKELKLSSHNIAVDRFEYHSQGNYAKHAEIGSSTFGSPSKFIFIYLSLENFYKLVKKYKLQKKPIVSR